MQHALSLLSFSVIVPNSRAGDNRAEKFQLFSFFLEYFFVQ